VSNQGGLGSIGSLFRTTTAIKRDIDVVRTLTKRHYAVNHVPQLLDVEAFRYTLAARPAVVSFALGDPGDLVQQAHDVGARVMLQVTTVGQAIEAAQHGVDVVIAQGGEAGGYGGTVSTMVLVPQVVDAVSPIPVVAAGGIFDGRGIAAALMLGSAGVNLGTRFLASDVGGLVNPRESDPAPGSARSRGCAGSPLSGRAGLVLHLGGATTIARAFDRDDLRVVHETIDEGGGGGRVGEHGRPVGEGQVGRDREALLLVPAADDLEEQVGRPGVVGEIAHLVDDQEGRLAIVLETAGQAACRVLRAEVEQELRRGREQDVMAGQHGLIGDVLGDHRFPQPLSGDQNQIVTLDQEVQAQGGVDGGAIEVSGPGPVERTHGGEAPDFRAGEAPLQGTAGAVLEFGLDEVLEELGGAEAPLGGQGDQIVEVGGRVMQP
jgi:hypothetical protein